MKRRLAKTILALGLLIAPVKASATGSLECVIDDANLDFSFHAIFNYTGMSPLFQIGGDFVSKVPKTYLALQKFEIEPSHLKQQWFEGQDLRLQFYSETSGNQVPFASVALTIITRQLGGDSETEYEGSYTFEVTPAVAPGTETQTIKLTGKASCSAG